MNDIIFDPAAHSYTNIHTNEKYTSVTQLLGTFKPKFDEIGNATNIAAREGCSVQDVLDRWKEVRDTATEYGTNIHEILENFIKNNEYEPENTVLCKQFKSVFPFSSKDVIESEKLLHLHEFKIAGTADIIKPYKGSFDVFDIKTNKEINFFSKYDEYMLHPVTHLASCEYSIYSLQISLYAYAYSVMTGKKFRQGAILHWDKENQTFTRYPVQYLKTDVINILNEFKKQQKN